MNGLTQDDSGKEVLKSLAEIGASKSWQQQDRAKKAFEVLEYLVKKALANDEVNETAIGQDVLKKEDYDPTVHNQVRTLARIIRTGLKLYNESEGQASQWMIDLPAGTYVPTFAKQQPTQSEAPPDVQPPPPRDTSKWRMPITIASLVVGGILVVASIPSIPALHEGHCGNGIAITFPKNGATVSNNEIVEGERTPQSFWCGCKDYLVVEVASGLGTGSRYNYHPISNSANWTAPARFGESNTADGTQYSIFVLSTAQDLKEAQVNKAVGKPSKVIRVTLKKPASP